MKINSITTSNIYGPDRSNIQFRNNNNSCNDPGKQIPGQDVTQFKAVKTDIVNIQPSHSAESDNAGLFDKLKSFFQSSFDGFYSEYNGTNLDEYIAERVYLI